MDTDGKAILTNFPRRIVLHHLSFKAGVRALAFSPSGTHFAAGVGRFIEVWETPSTPDSTASGELEFAPFVRYHNHAGHSDIVQSITWSSDSRFFLSASKDLTARVWSLSNNEDGFVPTTLAGHRQSVKAAWFSADQEQIFTVAKDGALFRWEYRGRMVQGEDDGDMHEEDHNQRWRISHKHIFNQDRAHITCATFHAKAGLLVTGFSNGVFTLHELPSFNLIHTLSISQQNISTVTINTTGEWLAFGASEYGQLLVWEWQSESQILKQQSHLDSLNALTYTPDGTRIITAADDGKLKLWDVQSGFCIVTFTEHTSGVTACAFAKRGSVLFTASLDGSVRVWDLLRYRNFRTFTGTSRLSFSCLAVDPSGEVVCAASIDSFDIHVWSVQTGQLLDQLAGHEGPVSSLAFSPDGSTLVSGSWDHTVRTWDIFSRTQSSEPLQLQSDVLCVAFRPDSRQIAVSSLDGSLTFWSVTSAAQESGVDARRDVSGGRKLSDRRTAANAAGTKHFGTVTYSAGGTCVLAGGNSKYICLYDVQSGVLLKKFTVSVNLDIEGTQEYLNSRNLTEAGPRELIDTQAEASDREDRVDRSLPGSSRTVDKSLRVTRPEVRVPGLAFSPSSRSFCAATTEGLQIFALESDIASASGGGVGNFDFDPLDLDVGITPQETLRMLTRKKDYLTALVMALRLSTNPRATLTVYVYRGIPVAAIELVVRELPRVYVRRVLQVVEAELKTSPHVEFNLRWCAAVMKIWGSWIRDAGKREGKGPAGSVSELRVLEGTGRRKRGEIMGMGRQNLDTVGYLLDAGSGVT